MTTNKNNTECFMCGACCIAYSISTLGKEGGVPCKHLQDNGKCGDYANRPAVCREYRADNLCKLISTLPLDKRVRVLSKVYMD